MVGAVVILVVVVGVLVVFVGLPPSGTTSHYQRQYPADETRFVNILLDLHDTNVTISFTDDTSLMYSADVVQYSSGNQHYAYYQEWEDPHYSLDFHVDTVDGSRIQSVDIVLGTGTYYQIYIDGDNVDASVIFDNGANLAGQDFEMNAAPGNLYFELTEDVSFSEDGFKIIGYGNTVDFDFVVDLPAGLNGRLEIDSTMTLGTHTMSGWSSIGANIWGTSSVTEPLLDIDVGWVGTVSFDFSD